LLAVARNIDTTTWTDARLDAAMDVIAGAWEVRLEEARGGEGRGEQKHG
jgi:hypothetical protein